MINLKNYAILAEQKKYGYFNRINESNGQTAENLKLVLSGENNDTYVKQWNQFMGDVEKNIQKDGTYTVKIKDNAGADMVSINYTIINNELPEDTIVLTPGKSTNDNTETDGGGTGRINTYSDEDLQKVVDDLVDCLDFPVYSDDVREIKKILELYVGQKATADDDTTKVSAIGRILTLYKRDEDGNTLTSDIGSIGTKTLDNDIPKVISQIQAILKKYPKEE
jgi:hypothetical protein